jgi:WD40 repeat protein/uncharacterized caspase-like protein
MNRLTLSFLCSIFVFVAAAQESVLVPPLGHADMIASIAASPDGKYIITAGGSDHTAMLWDSTGDLLLVLSGHLGNVEHVEFSKDGKYLLTVDGAIRIWTTTGALLKDFPIHYKYTTACLTPDSRNVIAGGNDGKLLKMDFSGKTASSEYKGGARGITDVVCTDDVIVSADSAGVIRVYKYNGDLKKQWQAHSSGPVSLALSANGNRILSGGRDKKAVLWDINGESLKTFGPYTGPVNDVAISTDSQRIAIGIKPTSGSDIFIAEMNGAPINDLTAFTIGINTLCFSADGQQVLAGSNDKVARSFNLNGNLRCIFGKGPGPVRYVSFSPDGRSVLCGSNGMSNRLWSLDSRDVVPFGANTKPYNTPTAFIDKGSRVLLCAFGDSILVCQPDGAPDGFLKKPAPANIVAVGNPVNNLFVTSDYDEFPNRKGSFQIWKTDQQTPIADVKAHRNSVSGLNISPDGLYLLTVSEPPFTDSVRLWDMLGKPVRSFGPGSGKAVFSRDGQLIGALNNNSSFQVWKRDGTPLDIAQSSPLQEIGKTNCLAFSPDGKSMLTGYSDNIIRRWSLEGHKLLQVYNGHSGAILELKYAPDGRHFISGSDDNTARIWDAETGKELISLIAVGQKDWVAITPDGLFDASAGAMNSLYFVNGLEKINLELLKRQYYEPGLLAKVMGYQEGGLRKVEKPKNEDLFPLIKSAVIKGDQLQVDIEERKGGMGKVMLLLNDNIKLEDNINPKGKSDFKVDLNEYAAFLFADSVNKLSIQTFNRDGWFHSEPYPLKYIPAGVGQKGDSSSTLVAFRPKKIAALESINLYALVVGTSKFTGATLNLKYPEKDAQAFANALQLAGKPLFGANMDVRVLTTDADPWPRRAEIKKILAEFAQKADPADVLLLYFSGHGVTYPPNSEKGQFYYLTTDVQDANLQDEAVRNSKTIAFDSLQAWIGQIHALKRILILDACNSGDVVDKLTQGEKSLGQDQIRALQQMQDESGLFVLAGSAASKSSFEASRFGHGLLTYSLLNNMPRVAAENPNGWVGVYNLFDYAQKEVPVLAKEIGKEQKPELLGRGNYPIGIVNDTVRIPRPSRLSVVIRPIFMQLEKKRDVIGLNKAVALELDKRAAETNPTIAFWNVEETQGDYFFIGGDYSEAEGMLKGGVILYRNADEIARFDFTVAANPINEETLNKLAEEIVDKVIDKME